MRVQTNSVLSKLTAGSAATMDNNRKAWKLYRADVEIEKNNRILIQKGLEKAAQKGERATAAAQKTSEEAATAIKKAADAEELAKTAAVERKRLREEERLKDEKEDRKREQEQLQKKLEVEPVQLLLFLLVF